MLQNEYLDPKIGVDTAENEPSKDLAAPAAAGGLRAERLAVLPAAAAWPEGPRLQWTLTSGSLIQYLTFF